MRRFIRMLLKVLTLPFYLIDDFVRLDWIPSLKGIKDYIVKQ